MANSEMTLANWQRCQAASSSALKPCDFRAAVGQFEPISIRERIREFFLMGHEQDAVQVAAKVMKFLNHHLSAVPVQAAEALVDDHRLDRAVLAAGVLADAQRKTHGHAK